MEWREYVLSGLEQHVVYDQFGEEGLKDMPPSGSHAFTVAGPSGPSAFLMPFLRICIFGHIYVCLKITLTPGQIYVL